MDFNEFLPYLREKLSSVSMGSEVLEQMDGFVSSLWQGKFLRSQMAFLSAQDLGISNIEQVVSICAGIECIHLASLIHDDIMDNAQTRRGQACFYLRFTKNKAIVVGDFLFGAGARLLGEVGAESLAGMAIEDICRGQLIEEEILSNPDATIEQYFLVAKNKTAALFRRAVEAVELLAGSGNSLSRFADEWGKAFQIRDDIGDIEEDFYELKMSFPVIMLRDLAGKEAFNQAVKDKKIGLLKEFLEDASALSYNKIRELIDGALSVAPRESSLIDWARDRLSQ